MTAIVPTDTATARRSTDPGSTWSPEPSVTPVLPGSGPAAGRASRAHDHRAPERAPAGTAIDVRPLDFDDQLGLVSALSGATTLYNTYWVRFARRTVDHERAVANSRPFSWPPSGPGAADCARQHHAPQQRLSASLFPGKALVERALAECDLSYAIVRPAILFGGDGVLLNNIAWLLRRLPVFAIGGRGDYRIRGIHVDDLARLCLTKGTERHDSVTDAVGPERPTFADLVGSIRQAVGSRARVIHVPGATVPVFARALGLALHDVLLTADEYGRWRLGWPIRTDPPPARRLSPSGWPRTGGLGPSLRQRARAALRSQGAES